MAHFYGVVQGDRGSTSRCGTKNSGIIARAAGWNLGLQIDMGMNSHGKDVAHLKITDGSNFNNKVYLLNVSEHPVLGKIMHIEPWLKKLIVDVYNYDPEGAVCLGSGCEVLNV